MEAIELASVTVASDAATSSPVSPPSSTLSASMIQRSASDTSSGASTAIPPGSPAVQARILVVEDSLPNRKLLMSLLKLLNCSVVGAEDGLVAVQLFRPDYVHADQCTDREPPRPLAEEPFDIVLIDGNMPGQTRSMAKESDSARERKVRMFVSAGDLSDACSSFCSSFSVQ